MNLSNVSLLQKILFIVVSIIVIGFSVLIVNVIIREEAGLLQEKRRSSEFLAQPVVHLVYKDMLDERADMARYLIEGMHDIEDVERLLIIRANGVEEAFQDYKTLREVEREYGELRPEWTVNHKNLEHNVAPGIDNDDFKTALAGFLAGSTESVSYIETVGDRKLFTHLTPMMMRKKCNACHLGKGLEGILMISTPLDEMYATMAASKMRWIIYGLLTVLIVTAVLTVIVRYVITEPIGKTADMLKAIAEGEGDLTYRLDVASNDEVGMLAMWFNKFIDGLQNMVKSVISSTNLVTAAADGIRRSSRGIHESTKTQLAAVKDTSISITEMDSSIKEVAADAERLFTSTEGASASSLQMSAAVSEVAENADTLAASVDNTSSGISQITASLKQVAEHVDMLQTETEQVVSATNEVNSTIKEVSAHAKEQAKLAERVKSDASELGMKAVDKTREGIEKIREEVAATAKVVGRLGKRSDEIGNIIGVIDEIAETTSLLSLNAAILAAQAGEHGKGFSVVAEEVKDLAERTAASTKEIAELIRLVQGEVVVAVKSMESSSKRVEEGVAVSAEASEALEKIVTSAEATLDMSKRVERATEEQTKGVGMVAESIHKISSMVEEIKRATDEQSRASDSILETTIQMQDITSQVKHSTSEQSRVSNHISEVITDVSEKMQAIKRATSEQKSVSDKIVQAIDTIKMKAEDNVTLAAELDKTVKDLELQAEIMGDKVGNFKVLTGDMCVLPQVDEQSDDQDD